MWPPCRCNNKIPGRGRRGEPKKVGAAAWGSPQFFAGSQRYPPVHMILGWTIFPSKGLGGFHVDLMGFHVDIARQVSESLQAAEAARAACQTTEDKAGEAGTQQSPGKGAVFWLWLQPFSRKHTDGTWQCPEPVEDHPKCGFVLHLAGGRSANWCVSPEAAFKRESAIQLLRKRSEMAGSPFCRYPFWPGLKGHQTDTAIFV